MAHARRWAPWSLCAWQRRRSAAMRRRARACGRSMSQALKGAKYVDLTHTITPNIPVWAGFADSTFAPARAGSGHRGIRQEGRRLHLREARLRGDGICAEDGSARHAARPAGPLGAGISGDRRAACDLRHQAARGHLDRRSSEGEPELRRFRSPTSRPGREARPHPGRLRCLRALGLVEGLARSEARHLEGIPGVGLDALKFLHEQRKILFHGHEPLDTDSTPNLEGEVWLMHHGYAQAEGVANLDKVPETGGARHHRLSEVRRRSWRLCALSSPSVRPDWTYGATIGAQDAPLPKSEKPLHYDAAAGMRVR